MPRGLLAAHRVGIGDEDEVAFGEALLGIERGLPLDQLGRLVRLVDLEDALELRHRRLGGLAAVEELQPGEHVLADIGIDLEQWSREVGISLVRDAGHPRRLLVSVGRVRRALRG